MVGETFGYRGAAAAQRAFEACSGGISISDWFLEPRDKCCGIAPNPPITGPGTIIVFTLGTFVNLLITLSWKSEGPYNLLAQVLATDGAFFALLARCIESENRLSEFHSVFVPLSIMSCIPVAVAALSVESWYLHNVSLPAYIQLVIEEIKHVNAIEGRPETTRAKTAPGMISLKHLPLAEREEQRLEWVRLQAELLKHPGAKRRSWLTPIICVIFIVHVVAWIALFAYVFNGYPDPAQPVCSEELDFRRYRVMIGGMCTGFILISCIFFLPLFLAFSKGWRAKFGGLPPDVWQYWGRLFHFSDSVEPALAGYKLSREIIRYGFAMFIFFAFVGCYVSVYLMGLREFILMGDTPFDYGQVAACIGILVPACVTARTWLDQRDSYNTGLNQLQNTIKELLADTVIEHEALRKALVAKAKKGKKEEKENQKAKKDKDKSSRKSRLPRPFRKPSPPPPFDSDIDVPLEPIPPPEPLPFGDLQPDRPLSLANKWFPPPQDSDGGSSSPSRRPSRSASRRSGSSSRHGSRSGESPLRSVSRQGSHHGRGGVDLSAEASGYNPVMSGALRRSSSDGGSPRLHDVGVARRGGGGEESRRQ
ncbi:hypothetical protein JCM11251_004370 [Rhodosporidiobolus azoricus]